MDIQAELLKEHSRKQAMKIADYACLSAKNFRELMQCFLLNEYRVAQRAAWSVNLATEKKPALIQPYIKALVAQLKNKNSHPAVVRNSVRILERIRIP
ncbi:MAG: hypothetical protein RLZZ28_458, partial [Bacteroidota bacterium]